MNKVEGKIEEVVHSDGLVLCKINVHGIPFTAIDLEDRKDRFTIGQSVHVAFKENEVFILKGDPGSISIRNRIPCRVEKNRSRKNPLQGIPHFQGIQIHFGHYLKCS